MYIPRSKNIKSLELELDQIMYQIHHIDIMYLSLKYRKKVKIRKQRLLNIRIRLNERKNMVQKELKMQIISKANRSHLNDLKPKARQTYYLSREMKQREDKVYQLLKFYYSDEQLLRIGLYTISDLLELKKSTF